MGFPGGTSGKEWSKSHSVLSDSLWPHGLYRPWNSPGQNTGVGSLSLLQGIFPTQGWNPGLLHFRCILYQLSHRGSPRILEWVTYPISSGSSKPRNRTGPPRQCRRHKRCGLGRSPGGGHGNPLQYSCLDNPRDRGSWWATIHRVAKTWHTHL